MSVRIVPDPADKPWTSMNESTTLNNAILHYGLEDLIRV